MEIAITTEEILAEGPDYGPPPNPRGCERWDEREWALAGAAEATAALEDGPRRGILAAVLAVWEPYIARLPRGSKTMARTALLVGARAAIG